MIKLTGESNTAPVEDPHAEALRILRAERAAYMRKYRQEHKEQHKVYRERAKLRKIERVVKEIERKA